MPNAKLGIYNNPSKITITNGLLKISNCSPLCSKCGKPMKRDHIDYYGEPNWRTIYICDNKDCERYHLWKGN